MLPVITISRQFGSGGREIGVMLAQKLGIKYLNKDLIAQAAKKSGLSEEVFAQADEKAGSSLLYSMVMGNYPFGRSTGSLELPINDRLFILQSELIREAADAGPCIIIGRCGDYILREYPNILRIFIHAEKEQRAKRAVDLGFCDNNNPISFITKMDKQRSNYHNFYCDNRWDDLSCYDLTINTSTFSTEQACQIILDAIHSMDACST